MKAPKISEKDLGKFMVDDNGKVWRMIGYTDQPTFTIERVDNTEIRHSWVIGAPVTEQYTKLVAEQKGDEEK